MASKRHGWLAAVAGMLVLGALGCQVDVGGQTLPSPYYTDDDVQYFPPGNEFYLANEAAALEARARGVVPVLPGAEQVPPGQPAPAGAAPGGGAQPGQAAPGGQPPQAQP